MVLKAESVHNSGWIKVSFLKMSLRQNVLSHRAEKRKWKSQKYISVEKSSSLANVKWEVGIKRNPEQKIETDPISSVIQRQLKFCPGAWPGGARPVSETSPRRIWSAAGCPQLFELDCYSWVFLFGIRVHNLHCNVRFTTSLWASNCDADGGSRCHSREARRDTSRPSTNGRLGFTVMCWEPKHFPHYWLFAK